VFVQETGDLTPQGTGLRRVFHRTGVIEEFLLQLFRQSIPLHDNRGTQTAKNMFLVFAEVGIAFFSEARIAWPGEAGIAAAIIFVRMQRLGGIVRQPGCVVGKLGKTAFSSSNARIAPGSVARATNSLYSAAFARNCWAVGMLGLPAGLSSPSPPSLV
jgi:hypothetical protein